MSRTKLFSFLLACCMLATAVAAAPASADPPETIWLGDVDTEVPTDCARVGDGVPMNAHWSRVPYDYESAPAPGSPEMFDGENALECAEAIFTFLVKFVSEIAPNDLNSKLHLQLRSALLSGSLDLTSPYETFINNIYITVPVLFALNPIPEEPADPQSGLASCKVTRMLLIHCMDDASGTILLRDQQGFPIVDGNGSPMSMPLNGLLTFFGGGTAYGSVFLQSEVYYTPEVDERVEHHEQVHAQQWAQWGWDFPPRYLNEWLTAPFEQLSYYIWNGTVENVIVPAACFNAFERAAHFADGNYAASNRTTPKVADGKNYPANWSTSKNENHGVGWNGDGWCPAKWL